MSSALRSWSLGANRNAVAAFLAASDDVPADDRVAYIDNDGTMWCEKPTYVEFDFFVDTLRRHVADEAGVSERPEFASVLAGDMTTIGELDLAKVAGALAALLEGCAPEEFGAVNSFLDRYRHPTLLTGLPGMVYQAMLALLDKLRAH